ncbi:MAG: restriction endonuclease subunit S [Candidatus Bipolaricaulota bacterium]|nr:restriction endonuclease subunit S [Candidatus Bipolaricaulota bacterium]
MKSDSSRALTWPKVQLGSVCESIRNGLSIKQGEIPGGIPITRIETISTGDIDPTRVGHAGVASGTLDQWVLRPGDILFSHINSLPHIGKCALYKGFPSPLIHGMNLLALRPALELVEPAFLLRFLRSPACRAQYLRFVNPSVNQASLSIGKLRLTEIPLPSLPEQRRIAAILDKADAVRRKRRQTLDLADQFLRSAFRDMFGDPVTNPKGWPVVEFGKLLADISYGTSKKCVAERGFGASLVLRIPNVLGGEITASDDAKYCVLDVREHDKLRLENGDLLFVRTNGNPEYIGRCAAFEGGNEPTAFASYLIRARLRQDAEALPVFVREQVSFPTYRSRLVRETRTTAGNYNVSSTGLRRLRLILPPVSEQERFTRMVETIGKLRQRHGTAREGENALLVSLTQRAFGGRL